MSNFKGKKDVSTRSSNASKIDLERLNGGKYIYANHDIVFSKRFEEKFSASEIGNSAHNRKRIIVPKQNFIQL